MLSKSLTLVTAIRSRVITSVDIARILPLPASIANPSIFLRRSSGTAKTAAADSTRGEVTGFVTKSRCFARNVIALDLDQSVPLLVLPNRSTNSQVIPNGSTRGGIGGGVELTPLGNRNVVIGVGGPWTASIVGLASQKSDVQNAGVGVSRSGFAFEVVPIDIAAAHFPHTRHHDTQSIVVVRSIAT